MKAACCRGRSQALTGYLRNTEVTCRGDPLSLLLTGYDWSDLARYYISDLTGYYFNDYRVYCLSGHRAIVKVILEILLNRSKGKLFKQS